MNTNSFSIFESIKSAWSKTKGAKTTFMAVFGCFIISFALQEIINAGFVYAGRLVGLLIIAKIVNTIIGACLMWGLIYLGVQRANDQPFEFRMISHTFNFKLVLKMIGVLLLQILVCVPALLLLFLPTIFITTTKTLFTGDSMLDSSLSNVGKLGTALTYLSALILGGYLSIRLSLAKTIAIAENVGPWTAIKLSFKATKSKVLKLLTLIVINISLIVLSLLPFGIGLIWSLPYYYINNGTVYKKLREQVAER